jgi:argininosuccinate lyase
MDDTGRIRQPLDWRAQGIVFGARADHPLEEELRFHVEIDRAHVVMLVERQLLVPDVAARLLTAIDRLVSQQYAPLRGRPAPRGVYLMYEDWLIESLGETVGGAAHLGRSRNDLNATVLRLRLRGVYARLVRASLRLLAVLTRTGARHARLTMPIYTHHQPALPITYGHYLTGVGLALLRDLRGLEDGARDLDRCPLGAGAAAGTTVPIDTGRTARLLGFTEGVRHSIDAVASRDLVLRLLGAAAILGVTLSRLAADLQLWSTAEFDLVRFPDTLVGSSSMLPQKRNPFLLEHIQGRAGAPLGAFTAAAMAMHATPFSNSVAVGTEGVKPLWHALDEIAEAAVLARLMVAGAQPQGDRMRRRAGEGLTFATELANRLAREAGFSFRQAHRQVGELVTMAMQRGDGLETAAAALFAKCGLTAEPGSMDPGVIAEGAAYGGGPAAASFDTVVAELRRGRRDSAHRLIEQSRRWREARRGLELAVAAVLTGHASPSESRAVAAAAQGTIGA